MGTIGGFLGLAVLRMLDRSYPPGQVARTTFGAPLQILFSVLFFGGLVASFFAVYYVDLGEKMVSEEENDG